MLSVSDGLGVGSDVIAGVGRVSGFPKFVGDRFFNVLNRLFRDVEIL